MDEQFLAADFGFLENSNVAELFEEYRSRLALGDAGFDQIGDAAIRLRKNNAGEFTVVDRRVF